MTKWNESFQKKLSKQFGAKKGASLYKKYETAFPHNYDEDYSTDIAIADVEYLEKVSAENPLEVRLSESIAGETPDQLDLRLYQWEKPIPLSDILPMMDNLDLRTINERPQKITLAKDKILWISDFAVTYSKVDFDVEKVKPLLEEAFVKIYFGLAENDGFNKLILGCTLSWHEITILRAYAKYLKQVGFRFSQPYIEKALLTNHCIARDLLALFNCLHDPQKVKHTKKEVAQLEQNIEAALTAVASLDEDRILRRILVLIKATLRTNFFQKDENGKNKPYISVKLKSGDIPELPLPYPLYEVFVYSPRFEAIHLRNTKVARGGIRWSDRNEDFRTEVLGLMKAQTVKNSVIVPSGAKGGFVLKSPLGQVSREALQTEVIFCYKSFIRGLLDITDNLKEKKVIRPKHVVCYDDADPYLVVAADKGTSTFSDIANGISAEYDFWLGDAFASGGRTGYDHKKIGITARGAWESAKRHFSELNFDINKNDITVVGIGDMSGDVFGNGMIYSKRIKLLAAFDHRDIFIDPTPDPATSFKERLRLFYLPLSSWEDYDEELISKGGGIFKRSLKFITITSQMKKAFNISEDSLTPNELIRALLKAPVDMLYNGGIGTYVKASYETQESVGDRTNEYCRVDGNELTCRTVVEGGNLGFTQLGRIEYALKGGLINTDFIDNSAGVDCSDHEVNLKILLDVEVHKGRLSEKKRNELLESVTDEVAALVLNDNYEQALVMSYSAISAKENINLHINYIRDLENRGIVKRKVEFLPTDKELAERKAAELGLTRPELAVLLAYTKIDLQGEILKTSLPEDPYLMNIVETAFPPATRKKYKKAMEEHRLHREIIATQLSNRVVNQMGITFVYRIQMETGATVEEVMRAYTISSEIFETTKIQKLIESLDYKIPVKEQYDMLHNVRHLINLSTRWFLHTQHLKEDLSKTIDHFRSRIIQLRDLTPKLMSGYTKDYLETLIEQFQKIGLPKDVAYHVATYRAIYTSLNIIEVATRNNFDLLKTARVYFAGGERINLVWFRDAIAKDTRDGHWNILSRLTLRDELDIAQRALTVAIMRHDKKSVEPNELIDDWMQNNERSILRWNRILNMLHASSDIEYSMFFIAMRELIGIVLASDHP